MRFVAGRGAGSEQERWHRARVLLRSKDAAVADRLVRGTAVAERLVRGAALAELLLAREPPAQRTAGRDADEAAARQGRCYRARAPTMHRRRCGASWQAGRGAAAEQERWLGARAANKAPAPLLGRGAGREQELARGVRS